MRKYKFGFLILSAVFIVLVLLFILQGEDVIVLHPKGWIGSEEKNLLITATLLMLIVVVPVLILTFVFAWKYREGKKGAVYDPKHEESTLAEVIWWGVPFIIIVLLSIITWKATYKLDPYKKIEDTNVKPLTVQVVALQWKWLFIYPEQKIASINYFEFPVNTPIHFEITADAPMNSFWLPQLSGQVFAMPAMRTELNIISDTVGTYRGCSANISGRGFAGMNFVAKVETQEEFNSWVEMVKNTAGSISARGYEEIALPSEYNPQENFVLQEPGLFEYIVMKYMMPQS